VDFWSASAENAHVVQKNSEWSFGLSGQSFNLPASVTVEGCPKIPTELHNENSIYKHLTKVNICCFTFQKLILIICFQSMLWIDSNENSLEKQTTLRKSMNFTLMRED
jgi:hypothetical protein